MSGLGGLNDDLILVSHFTDGKNKCQRGYAQFILKLKTRAKKLDLSSCTETEETFT